MMDNAKLAKTLRYALDFQLPPSRAALERILELLEARCRDCANCQCAYDRVPVCPHFEPKDVEL